MSGPKHERAAAAARSHFTSPDAARGQRWSLNHAIILFHASSACALR